LSPIISTGNSSLESIAKKMVELQNFDYNNFQDAKHLLEFEYADRKCFIEFDRITLFRYQTNLSEIEYGIVFKNLEPPLRLKLSSAQQKDFTEYHVLRCFLEYSGITPHKIIKKVHPDFKIEECNGNTIGIEIVQLTTSINQLQNSLSKKYANRPLQEVEDTVRKELGKYSEIFNLIPHEKGFYIVRKDASPLASELKENATQLVKKYLKYKNQHNLIDKYDRFIILGDALISEVAIVNEQDAEEIINNLCCVQQVEAKVVFAILFQDHNGKGVSVITHSP
jgi:hypothetical protein